MLVSDMPKGSCKVISSSEKAKVSDLIKKEKNHMLRLLKSMVRTIFLHEIVERTKKKFVLVLLLCFKLQKLWHRRV